MTTATMDIQTAKTHIDHLRSRLRHTVKGRDDVIELILVALLSDGHVLLEDYPGSGKTTLAKTLGESIVDDLPDDDIPDFRRIQFTPDLLPSDVTGMTIFDSDTKQFQFRRGPIFAYVVLGDEINRTSPKVQSSMLEAMAEKQVTVDNVSYPLDELFFVIATQNPLDLAGTYPLPTAQLDRFLFKIKMEFIDRDSEIEVLNSEAERAEPLGDKIPRVNRGNIVLIRRMLSEEIYVNPKINECLVDIARSLRDHPDVSLGVSTRCLVLMKPALRAAALLKGRDYVTEEDISWLAPHVFSHRLSLEMGRRDPQPIIEDCLKKPLEQLSRSTLKK
jgi:MoxR-like ATPase